MQREQSQGRLASAFEGGTNNALRRSRLPFASKLLVAMRVQVGGDLISKSVPDWRGTFEVGA